MKASLIFFPNASKKNQKTGKIPLYLRICFRRTKAESRLNMELSENDCLIWDPITMQLKQRNNPVNHYLSRIRQKFQEFVMLNATEMEEFTASKIRDIVLGYQHKAKIGVMEFVDEYFKEAVMNNVNLTQSTIKNYRRAINHLHNFLSHKKQQALTIDELNFEFASNFKNYLVSNNLAIGRVGMDEASAATVIKKFRTIFNQAVDQDILSRNPFKQVKIKTKSPRKERLTMEQVKTIFTLNLNLWPFLSVYRDIFLFSVFTGLAYKDAMELKWTNLHERNDGNIKLTITRTKSDVITECFLPKQAIEIARKYRVCHDPENAYRVLPYRTNQNFNSQLKLLAQLSGINIKLTTHIARHTFRQLLAETEIFDMAVVKRMMGHSSLSDIDGIYYHVTEKGLLDAKCKFEKYLNRNLHE